MPFTLSHPAAVVPLARWLPLSAMVAGAVAPDLYFLAIQTMPVAGGVDVPVIGKVTSTYAHTWPGTATFSLPIAGCLWYVFHAMAKWPLVALFPPRTRRRLTPLADASSLRRHAPAAGGWAAVVAGLLVGLGTHLLWDASTHQGGWVTDLFPILGARIPLNGHQSVRIDEGLFILSSILGLVFIGWWWRRWLATAPVGGDLARPWRERSRVAILTLAFLGSGLLFAWLWQRQYWPVNQRDHFPMVLSVVIALHQMQQGAVIAILTYCLVWWVRGHANGGRPYLPPELQPETRAPESV